MSFDTFIQKGGGGGAPQGRKRKPRGGAEAPPAEAPAESREVQEPLAPDPFYPNLDKGGFGGFIDTIRKGSDDAQRYMIDNMTFSLMDPAVGWASDKINQLTGYGDQEGGVARERARTEQASKDLPMAAKVPLTVASAIVQPTATEALMAKGAGMGRRILAETIEGAGQGALSAAGHGGDAEDIKSGAGWGGVFGGAGGLASGIARKGGQLWADWTGGTSAVEREAAKLGDEADRAFINKTEGLDKRPKENRAAIKDAERLKKIRQGEIREDFKPLDAKRQAEIDAAEQASKFRNPRKLQTNPNWEEDEMLARLATQVNPRKVAAEKFGNTLQGGGGWGKLNPVPMLGGSMAGTWIKGRAAKLPKWDPELVEAAKASLRGPIGKSELLDRETLARLLSRSAMTAAR